MFSVRFSPATAKRTITMPHKFFDRHVASRQHLASLANPNLLPHDKLLLVDLKNSQGPILQLCNGDQVFDLRQFAPPRIGYNASPLFGTIHYWKNWLGNSAANDIEAEALLQSYDQLRTRNGLPPDDRSRSHATINRDYVCSFICDQYSDQADQLSHVIQTNVDTISNKFAAAISEARMDGLSFSFAPVDAPTRNRLLESRLNYGLLFDVEEHDFRFTLNLGFRAFHTKLLWDHLNAWLAAASVDGISIPVSKVTANYQFHQTLLEQKLLDVVGENDRDISPARQLQDELDQLIPNNAFEVQVLTTENYQDFRQQILDMQAVVYEPARQTPAEEFDALFDRSKLQHKDLERPPLAIVVLEEGNIVSMAFAGPLEMFTCERGVTSDPYLDHPNTYYMLDLTVIEAYRGQLGRLMKNAITLLATQSGVHAIHGRNRERLARGMWAINLSLGSYELQHLPDDYPDEHQYRDCIYYRCPLLWNRSDEESLSDGILVSPEFSQLGGRFLAENMSSIVNGTHETDTLTFRMVKELDFFASHWPASLRHLLATCPPHQTGQQIWKIIKSHRIPRNQPNHIAPGIICVEGYRHSFPDECQVTTIANPCHSGKVQYLDQLEAALDDDSKNVGTVIIEPITSDSYDRFSSELLKQTVELCRDYHVPIGFAESGSLLYRYGNQFAASCHEDHTPDFVVATLGRSMTVLLGQRDFQPANVFLGGEAVELSGFNEVVKQIRRDIRSYQTTLQQFDQTIVESIANFDNRHRIENGIGWIEGAIPDRLRSRLRQNSQNRFLACPSIGQMKRASLLFGSGESES